MTTDSIEAKSLSKRIQLVAPLLFSILLLNTSSAQNHEELGARRPSIPITRSEPYSAAQRASVQVLIRDEHHKLIPAGSGVWIEKDIVATCFHVIKDSNGPVVVCVLSGTHVNVAAHQISKPQITVLKSAVAETDQASDIALLRVELGGSIMGHNELPIGVMQIGKNVPDTGGGAWLAGYPFGSPALLIRKTAVAGAGILPDSSPGSSDFDQYRLFISNGSIGDSGGPVLDESGELVGLIQGNLPGPVVDEQQRHSSTYDRSGMPRVTSSKIPTESRKLKRPIFLGLQD